MSSPYQSPQPVAEASGAPAGQAYRVPPRPVGPTIFGILNLLLGVVGVLGIVMWVVMLIMYRRGLGGPNPFFDQMFDSTPFWIYTLVTMVLGSIFTLVLIAAGVGMLKTAPWGRTLSIAYSVYNLVIGVVGVVVNYVVVVAPMMRQASATSGPEAAGAVIGALAGLFGTCFWMIYPLVLLVYCYRPSTKRIFSGATGVPTAA